MTKLLMDKADRVTWSQIKYYVSSSTQQHIILQVYASRTYMGSTMKHHRGQPSVRARVPLLEGQQILRQVALDFEVQDEKSKAEPHISPLF